MALLIGTRKGLFSLTTTDRIEWCLEGPAFLGHTIQHVVADPRPGGRMLAGTRTGHLGPTVHVSSDRGVTWHETSRPPAFHPGDRLARALDAVFWLTPGHFDEPGVWYAGGVPQGLFRSEDHGDTWQPVDGWCDHPSWAEWTNWGEDGSPDGSMLHSINVDPRDPNHLYLGLSGGGVFESTDGGLDWHPLNSGCRADFFPDPYPEYGHDPHCLRLHPLAPDRLYQQNHCGIYRMDRRDGTWVRIGDHMPPEVGDIGFPIELHPRDPDTVWVFPMDGTDVWPRTSPDGRPAVYRSRDGGESWQRCDAGLPRRAWYTVKRQAMTTDTAEPVGVYFGTTSGEIWGSNDEGETWRQLAAHLPEIYSLEWFDDAENST